MHSLSIASAVLRGLFRFDVVMKTLAGALLAGFLSQAAHAVPFQQFRSSTNCPNPQSLCEVDFPVVAANRAVTITNVSCLILLGTQTVEILQAQFNIVNTSNQVTVQDAVLPVLQGRAALGTYFSVNQQTLLTYGTGFKLRASVATDAIASMFLRCKIAGDIRVIP